jgi:hypothetical protein
LRCTSQMEHELLETLSRHSFLSRFMLSFATWTLLW